MKTEIESHLSALLLRGVIYESDRDGRPFTYPNTAEAKRLWKKIGDSVTADFIKSQPGQRPFAWWRWSLPAGLPAPPFTWEICEMGRQGGVARRNREQPSAYQQTQYLRENRLLSASEIEALAAESESYASIGN